MMPGVWRKFEIAFLCGDNIVPVSQGFHWVELITFSQCTEGHAVTFVLLKVSFLSHLKTNCRKIFAAEYSCKSHMIPH